MSLFEVVQDELDLTAVRELESGRVREQQPQPVGEDVVRCPECDGHATIEWRSSSASTNGPVEHVKVRCATGHWFLMPAAWLTEATA